MSEYNKQRYYWIKLTDHFLTSDTVDFLLSQKNGANYVVLYQMLCLKSVNSNGLLARQIGEIIVPYDVEKIQRDCKHFDIDTVRVALELYKKLGLVYEQQDGILQITDFDRLIGSQTISAEKKQIQIANRQSGKQGGTKVENFPPEIKILRDKEIDIEEKNIIKKENPKIQQEFEEVWKLYPRKEDKKKAFMAYKSARKKASFDEIKKGVETYNNHIKASNTDKCYIKLGATYFNGECWANTYEQRTKQGKANFTEREYTKEQLDIIGRVPSIEDYDL